MELLITDFLVEPPLTLGYLHPPSYQQTLDLNGAVQLQANFA